MVYLTEWGPYMGDVNEKGEMHGDGCLTIEVEAGVKIHKYTGTFENNKFVNGCLSIKRLDYSFYNEAALSFNNEKDRLKKYEGKQICYRGTYDRLIGNESLPIDKLSLPKEIEVLNLLGRFRQQEKRNQFLPFRPIGPSIINVTKPHNSNIGFISTAGNDNRKGQGKNIDVPVLINSTFTTDFDFWGKIESELNYKESIFEPISAGIYYDRREKEYLINIRSIKGSSFDEFVDHISRLNR